MSDTPTGDRALRLARNGLLRLAGAPGVAIRCRSGLVWITAERDRNDYVLRAGESMVVLSGGRVLIEAERDSELELLPARRVANRQEAPLQLSEATL